MLYQWKSINIQNFSSIGWLEDVEIVLLKFVEDPKLTKFYIMLTNITHKKNCIEFYNYLDIKTISK